MLRRAVFSYSLFSFAIYLTITAAIARSKYGGDWPTAEWLINYSGGFVRRGLAGTLYMEFFPPGQDGLWWLLFFNILFYSIVATFMLLWLHRSEYRWSAIVLALSPVALSIVGWEAGTFPRKEWMVYSALVLLALPSTSKFVKSRGIKANYVVTIFGLLLFAFSIFTWEPSALLLPAALYLVNRNDQLERARIPFLVVASIIAVIGFLVSAKFSGDPKIVSAICESISQKGLNPDLCKGAPSWLDGRDTERAIQLVRGHFPDNWGYLPFAGIAVFPIMNMKWTRKRWLLFFASGVALLPLFFVGIDYGRWIAMFVMSLLICRIADGPLRDDREEHYLQWTSLSAIMYVTMWGMPHYVWKITTWPWRGALHELVQILIENGPS